MEINLVSCSKCGVVHVKRTCPVCTITDRLGPPVVDIREMTKEEIDKILTIPGAVIRSTKKQIPIAKNLLRGEEI